MALKAIKHKKIIKKRIKKFVRFESEDYPHKLTSSWRKPRGIDCRVRRKFRGNKKMVKIGFGSDKKTRYLLKNGFKKFLISNEKDIDILLMNNKTYCGELAHNLSAQKRIAILKRAAELSVRLTNGKSRVKVEEKKAE